MARLFGIIGNRADLMARVFAVEGATLKTKAKGVPLGWGLGFYQGGEVLIRRRPIDERQEVDVAALVSDVRADVLLGHVRQATVGVLRTENTHPFRYRQWLFAQTGTVSEFERVRERLIESVPEFLRGGIRGETDAEVVFHVFLSFLHDAGLLGEAPIEAPLVRNAIRSTLAVVDGMTAELGKDAAELNIMISNGELVVAIHRGSAPMRLRVISGAIDAEAMLGEDALLRRKIPELARMRFSMAASDFDEVAPNGRWKAVPERSIVTMLRDVDPRIEAL
jgi:predicted glutamine amidotransferase